MNVMTVVARSPVLRLVTPALCAAGICAMAWAAPSAWYYNLTIRNVRFVGDSGIATFATNQTIVNPGGCSSADFYEIAATDNAKVLFQALLTARVTGDTVSLYVLDTCGPNGRPRVTNVLVGTY
jgi:hypothetical protein